MLFISGVAFLAAATVNGFVEQALRPAPTGGAPRRATPATVTAVAAGPRLDLARVAKVLGLPVPKPEPVVQEPNAPTFDENAAPVKSPLRVRLLGTLVSESHPEASFASIQDSVTLKSQTYMIDDLVQTAKILTIERARVIVLNGGRREYIDGVAGDGMGIPQPVAALPVAPPSGPPPPATAGLGSGIKQLGENDYELPRSEIDRTLSNLNDVAMQARIVPAFKDGQATGFKLFSIRPDSIYSKIGVQNGDVIRRINGYDLNSPEKALEVYSKLKEAGRIDIELERGGGIVRKTYNVR